ncbi:MAG: hypothetical protein KA191_09425 [Verrucomicrobia bacterium]|nr:hypothetical protein [Verrucomicrobiota bacterium]MDI9381117.1 hypothetical protein [Verrucomicrobiota bacterium]NMD22510.1 hypothetical protein [Verrucomicrobiota bacterium]HNU99952.1 hypothetical protein [Verrucomicrobiota bacterium]HOA62059.1 hypothetical protein [Verrucomicrobiota bacterium]
MHALSYRLHPSVIEDLGIAAAINLEDGQSLIEAALAPKPCGKGPGRRFSTT